MDLSKFNYELPNDLIAQEPSKKRSDSRLMVYNRKKDTIIHSVFSNLNTHLPSNSNLYRNEVSVLKAKIFGKRKTGGIVECLLLNQSESKNTWWCLLKPGKKSLKNKYFYNDPYFEAEVLEINSVGQYKVRFRLFEDDDIYSLAQKLGKMPLPPYIKRSSKDHRDKVDEKRYQTIYANKNKHFAAAAPTAGLHFTNKLISSLIKDNHKFFDLTLNVGIGTFQPIKTKRIEDHKIHTESYEISKKTIEALKANNLASNIAIGTTSLRTIETLSKIILNDNQLIEKSISKKGYFNSTSDLYIYPPYNFNLTNGLITNFHLPRSSLLCLVSAFLAPNEKSGIDKLKELYHEAIDKKYNFFSYGDAMLIL